MDNGTRNSMGETVYSSEDASAVMSEKVRKFCESLEKIDRFMKEEGGVRRLSIYTAQHSIVNEYRGNRRNK